MNYTESAKTIMYLEIMFAQETYARLLEHNHMIEEHNHMIEELEQLIGEAYWSDNKQMENLYRKMLELYESTGYDL